MFGLEILPPANAVWQVLHSMAIDVLTNDVETIVDAIEHGFFVVDKKLVCEELRLLREALDGIGNVELLVKLCQSV